MQPPAQSQQLWQQPIGVLQPQSTELHQTQQPVRFVYIKNVVRATLRYVDLIDYVIPKVRRQLIRGFLN